MNMSFFDRIHQSACEELYKPGEASFMPGFKRLQEQFGGTIWNSGGGCMLLSIITGDRQSITVSEELVCEYEPREGVTGWTYDDLLMMDDDKTICIASRQINRTYLEKKNLMIWLSQEMQKWLSAQSVSERKTFKNIELAFHDMNTNQFETRTYFRR